MKKDKLDEEIESIPDKFVISNWEIHCIRHPIRCGTEMKNRICQSIVCSGEYVAISNTGKRIDFRSYGLEMKEIFEDLEEEIKKNENKT